MASKKYPKVNLQVVKDRREASNKISELNIALQNSDDHPAHELKSFLYDAFKLLDDSYYAVLYDRQEYLTDAQVNELSAIIAGLTGELINQYRYSSL